MAISRYDAVARGLMDALANGETLLVFFPDLDWPAMTWDLTGAADYFDELDRCFSIVAALTN